MAAVIVPLRSDLVAFDLQASLEGVIYTLDFRWNTRASAWWMTVLDDGADVVLVGNTRVVVDFPINGYVTERQPPGVFLFIDTSRKGEDPGLNDLGARVQLVYVPSTDL